MTTLFIHGLIWHLIADWVFQNHWMATNKTVVKNGIPHLAGWVHAGFHLMGFLIIFNPTIAVLLGVSHLLIDTRTPLVMWRKHYGQLNDASSPAFVPFAFMQDQAIHVIFIYFAALFNGGAA